MNNTLPFIINCPHCNEPIYITELNCRIFRHGAFKKTYDQINPHATKDECETYIKNDLIIGCGKPFIINIHEKKNKIIYSATICDYI